MPLVPVFLVVVGIAAGALMRRQVRRYVRKHRAVPGVYNAGLTSCSVAGDCGGTCGGGCQ